MTLHDTRPPERRYVPPSRRCCACTRAPGLPAGRCWEGSARGTGVSPGQQGQCAAQTAGVLSVEVALAWAGGLRWTGTEPETPVGCKGLFSDVFYKKGGLFRKRARKWGEVQVLRAQWGLGWASLLTGRKHAQKPSPGLATPQESGQPWPFLLRTQCRAQGLQPREAGAGSWAAAPSEHPLPRMERRLISLKK